MTDEGLIQPPQRLRELAQWQLGKVAALGARFTASRMPAGGRSDFAVLATLDEYGPLSQADLGRRLGLDRNDISVIITRLSSAGHVDRQADPTDGRRNTVTTTAKGLRHFAELQGHADAVTDELLAALDADERARLTALLTKVLDGHAPQPA